MDNCRSQCYDNAAVVSGHISGVQKLIIDKNLKSIFTNCDNHSLNLCGVHASHEEPELVTFLAAVERLWTFFRAQLYDGQPYDGQQESETRRSARADAVAVVYKNILN